MTKQEITDQIIKDILALPNAKTFVQVLQKSLENIDPNNKLHNDIIPMVKWILQGKYIDNSIVDEHIHHYIGTSNKPGAIESIILDIVSSLPNNTLKLLDQPIIELFRKLPPEKINFIIGKYNLINAMIHISNYFEWDHEWGAQKNIVDLLVMDVNNHPDELVDPEYVYFIVDPDRLIRWVFEELSKLDYKEVSWFVDNVITTVRHPGHEELKEEYNDMIDTVDEGDKLRYELEILNKLGDIGRDINIIYNHFYPAPAAPEPPSVPFNKLVNQ